MIKELRQKREGDKNLILKKNEMQVNYYLSTTNIKK